jgi:hypothetical protein
MATQAYIQALRPEAIFLFEFFLVEHSPARDRERLNIQFEFCDTRDTIIPLELGHLRKICEYRFIHEV